MSSILPHRTRPTINVNAETGVISWDKVLVDHNEDAFYRGKTVTNDEFNDLFVRHALQGDYLADTLEQLFSGGSLTAAVSSTFRNQFHLKPSYIKIFDSTVWGTADADGYYHIVIPASEHGFAPTEASSSLEAMNIDTEMYVLSNGRFYEVTQVNTTPDNTVTIYTDDNTLTGFVVIRLNDKSYALSEATVDVTQVIGLAPVATSGDFDDLTNTGNLKARVGTLEDSITNIISGTTGQYPFVHNADYATNADTAVHLAGENASINNIPISNIFEPQSRVVKEAANGIHFQAFNSIPSLLEFCTTHVIVKAIFKFSVSSFTVPVLTMTQGHNMSGDYSETSLGNVTVATGVVADYTNCLEAYNMGGQIETEMGPCRAFITASTLNSDRFQEAPQIQLNCYSINPYGDDEPPFRGGIVAVYTNQVGWRGDGITRSFSISNGYADLTDYFVNAYVYYTD